MPEQSPPQDLVALQTRLLQLRACLYDPETDLPTLPAVLDQVRRLLDDHGSVRLLQVRIEQEQVLERIVGWERYDGLLRFLAARLREILATDGGRGWLLCQEHVRGDEFMVFLGDGRAADRVLGRLGGGLQIAGDDTAGDPEMLPLRTGRGVVRRQSALRTERCIYNALVEARQDLAQQGRALDRARERELRAILAEGRVSTVFQPIFRMPEREVIGYEALSRGPRATYLEAADNLFGFAERAGLLGELERLCVDRALESGVRLPRESTVFLNLSIVGLEHLESAGGGLAAVVERWGWSPRKVVLEITERTYADDPERLRDTVGLLRRRGFRVAIDDMGTGYSSLHVLADLKPDFIKLDHMLVRDLATEPIKQNLVSALTGFAATSESLVIAEGVERRDELDVLMGLGISLVQGFYFGQPEGV